MPSSPPSNKRSDPTLVMLPLEPGRKHVHLAVITHRGGGWYQVECMGEAKRCGEGACKHTANMRWKDSARPIRQVPRDGVDSARKAAPRRANVRGHGHRGKDPQ